MEYCIPEHWTLNKTGHGHLCTFLISAESSGGFLAIYVTNYIIGGDLYKGGAHTSSCNVFIETS